MMLRRFRIDFYPVSYRAILLIVLFVLLLGSGGSRVQSSAVMPTGFHDLQVADVASPTALAFTPDGRLLITSQSGRLWIYQDGALHPTPALDLSARTCSNGERGLLGIAVDPDYARSRFVYLYYTFRKHGVCPSREPANPANPVNRVARFVLSATNTIDPASEQILVDNIPSPNGNHNGGDLHFGPDGHLYISVGDGGCDYAGDSGCGGDNDAARDPHMLLGKILRITSTGGIPSDNPFQGPDSARCAAAGGTDPGNHCQETFAWGLRNPFRFAFRAGADQFYINDVGQSRWEEIDPGQRGADYGWNMREGFCRTGTTNDCGAPPPGTVDPIFAYGREDGCGSITGGAFVPAGAWPAPYDGAYLFGDFICGAIFRLVPAGGGSYTKVPFVTGLGQGSAVTLVFGPYGGGSALYYTSYAEGGQVRVIAYLPHHMPHRTWLPLVARSQ